MEICRFSSPHKKMRNRIVSRSDDYVKPSMTPHGAAQPTYGFSNILWQTLAMVPSVSVVFSRGISLCCSRDKDPYKKNITLSNLSIPKNTHLTRLSQDNNNNRIILCKRTKPKILSLSMSKHTHWTRLSQDNINNNRVIFQWRIRPNFSPLNTKPLISNKALYAFWAFLWVVFWQSFWTVNIKKHLLGMCLTLFLGLWKWQMQGRDTRPKHVLG